VVLWGLQGDWNSNEGKCRTVIHLETQFSKKTMWRKAIEAGSKSANVSGMKDLMHMVCHWTTFIW
jgi:hypothetical protein